MAVSLAQGMKQYREADPRYFVLFLLVAYNLLGITILGFNRNINQILLTCAAAMLMQVVMDKIFLKKIVFPISALITALGLSILVNYGHSWYYPLVPVFFAIGSKFFFTLKGRHVFNPGLMGVALSLLITNEFITAAPAYQWNGIENMSLFLAMPAILLFMPKVNRHYLVLSFLGVFTLQIILRSILIKHYLPFNTLFFGTISSPAFFLFTFFMITDPPTTPSDRKEQVKVGALIALFDLFYHLFKSYHTFFYAGLTMGAIRLIQGHYRESKNFGGLRPYINTFFFQSKHYQRVFGLLSIMGLAFLLHEGVVKDSFSLVKPGFTFKQHGIQTTNLDFKKGELLESVDPRVAHMGKWILAITDGIAVGDINQDGLLDILMNNAHKSAEDRNALFLNQGNFKFQRLEMKELSQKASDFKKYGVPANSMFVDYDGDGDLDIYITYAFGQEGSSRLFQNQLTESGKLNFLDKTKELGLHKFSNSATANWFDFNRDGKLDLISGNTIRTHLPDYTDPTPLNLFELPKEEFEGDIRMYDFMHESWHMANNGAENFIFLNQGNHFKQLDPKSLGMPETRWTMAIATADFNKDGYTDLYAANDFGADDLYLNLKGKGFKNIKGETFGTIGKDTYKGMNATIADFDRNGWMDVYISNVHHALQAEGSLLWQFYPNSKDQFIPQIKDQATYTGALNENRFGWGGGVGDFNNDGWVDLTQANGMVDNKFDKTSEDCPDFWYINEKIARSPPSIHKYIHNWGDIRGTCIHGYEKNRLYLNRGTKKSPQFKDIADQIGMGQKANFRGMAVADFNNDGAMDLIVTSLYRNPLVFENELKEAKKNQWIGLSLESQNEQCNREAAGSRVIVHYFDRDGAQQRLVQEKVIVNGFSAQSDPRIHFGLGPDIKLKDIEILWCGKISKTYKNLSPNQYHKIKLL